MTARRAGSGERRAAALESPGARAVGAGDVPRPAEVAATGARAGALAGSVAPPERAALDFLAGSPLAGEVEEALVRARAAALLEDLYDARGRLVRASQALAAERAQEIARIERKSEIFLNSVATARALAQGDSAAPHQAPGARAAPIEKRAADPYAAFLGSAERELAAARAQLDARAAKERELFTAEIARASDAIARCAQSMLAVHAPRAALSIQTVGRTHAVAWMDRPTPDDAVLLCYLLSGRLPTHYDALFDDALDDLALVPATFFAEEGFVARPSSDDEAEALCQQPDRAFVPFKAMIPFRLPDRDFPRLRFVNQGPVLQLVAREARGNYESLMPLATAEAVAGLLIRLQVEGRIALEFKAM